MTLAATVTIFGFVSFLLGLYLFDPRLALVVGGITLTGFGLLVDFTTSDTEEERIR